jgi:hypothetical protein
MATPSESYNRNVSLALISCQPIRGKFTESRFRTTPFSARAPYKLQVKSCQVNVIRFIKLGFVRGVASFHPTDVEIAGRSFAMKPYHRIARQSSKQTRRLY